MHFEATVNFLFLSAIQQEGLILLCQNTYRIRRHCLLFLSLKILPLCLRVSSLDASIRLQEFPILNRSSDLLLVSPLVTDRLCVLRLSVSALLSPPSRRHAVARLAECFPPRGCERQCRVDRWDGGCIGEKMCVAALHRVDGLIG
ncbi:unnamed protein product [Protopolystoma xenopodis]|uniref:Uncharacterized protein n=1 Tax=Protopolystoma xenopodis TaxID=117903 RepID=A0A3S5BTN3_9PLAT|nr:unnamed protein product [Protopolystoma xenopodis]